MGKEELAQQLQTLVDRYMRAQLWALTGYTGVIPQGQPLYDAFFCITPTCSFDTWCERAGENIDTVRKGILETENDAAIEVLKGIGGPVKVEESGEEKQG